VGKPSIKFWGKEVSKSLNRDTVVVKLMSPEKILEGRGTNKIIHHMGVQPQ